MLNRQHLSPPSLSLINGSNFTWSSLDLLDSRSYLFCWKSGKELQNSLSLENGAEVDGMESNLPIKTALFYSLSEGLQSLRGWASWGEQKGMVLLYLKRFLTSSCAPLKGPASSVWLGLCSCPLLHCLFGAAHDSGCCLPLQLILWPVSVHLNAPASEACFLFLVLL